MSIATTTETFGGGDYRWLKSARGTEHPEPGTLDYSAFTPGTHFPNGYIPSGLAVAEITSSGLYGPWGGAAAANEVQKVTVATAGNTTIGFQGVTATAASVTADASGATALKAILEGLPDIDPGDFTIAVGTGADEGKLIVTFGGKWKHRDVPTLTATGTGASVSTATAGTPGASDGTERTPKFVFHDRPLAGTNDVPVALLNDVTIVAEFLPVPAGLTDGRYIANRQEA